MLPMIFWLFFLTVVVDVSLFISMISNELYWISQNLFRNVDNPTFCGQFELRHFRHNSATNYPRTVLFNESIKVERFQHSDCIKFRKVHISCIKT